MGKTLESYSNQREAEAFRNAFFKKADDMLIENFGELDPDTGPRVEMLYKRMKAGTGRAFSFVVMDREILWVYLGAKSLLAGLEINMSNLRSAEDWQRVEESLVNVLNTAW